MIPNVPNKLPKMLKEYKEKNHLTTVEMITKINNLIDDPEEKIQFKIDDYGQKVPPTIFNRYLSSKYNSRPKNITQRNAILKLLKTSYINTIFSNGNEVIDYFQKCYEAMLAQLKEIQQNNSLTKEKSIYTREALKEKLIESSSIEYRSLAEFTWHLTRLLLAFNITFSLNYTFHGSLSWEDLSQSNFIFILNGMYVNYQTKLFDDDTKKKLVKKNKEILDKLIHDIKSYQSDFFSTFTCAEYPTNPLTKGQFPNEFKAKNVYSMATHHINNLTYTQNEKRAIFNTSLDMLETLFDILGTSIVKNSYIKIIPIK